MKTMVKSTILLPLLMLGARCGNYVSTPDLLAANFSAAPALKITPIQPVEGTQRTSMAITFDWSSSVSIPYVLEIARDRNFSSLILQKSTSATIYSWLAADNIAGVTIKTGIYFWRVRSDSKTITTVSEIRSLYLIIVGSTSGGEILYVNKASQSNIQNGSPLYPYKGIANTVPLVDALRNNVASQPMRIIVAGGEYVEQVSLIAGISLYGGYDSDTSVTGEIVWARNISGRTSTIQAPVDDAVTAGSDVTLTHRPTTIIDGFTIRGGSTGTSRGIILSSSSPTISNNIIYGGTGAARRIAIDATQSAAIVQGNTIIGASTSGPNLDVMLLTQSSGILIEKNTIMAETASGYANTQSYIVRCLSSCAPIIRNNLILAGNSSAFYWLTLISGTVLNNTFYSTGSASYVSSGGTVTFENNVLGASGGTCSTGTFTSLKNNNAFGCTLTGGTSTTTINNSGGQLFASIAGGDGNVYTMTDNDWHLTNQPAICDVRVGGLNQSGSFNSDFSGILRSAVNHCGSVLGGAAGWSMGAYESD